MALVLLQRLLLALAVFAFIGGSVVQATPRSEASKVAVHCSDMNMRSHASAAHKAMPTKSMMPDCMKQLGCVCPVSVPIRSDVLSPVSYGPITYWTTSSTRTGRSITPDPFPPITL